MKHLFHLSTCNTCQRIIKELDLSSDVVLQDIKTAAITEEQLEGMKALSGSYESLFSKRSRKYREWDLHEKTLSEDEMKALILKEYTFLKRPVLIWEDKIFVGNTKKVVEEAKLAVRL